MEPENACKTFPILNLPLEVLQTLLANIESSTIYLLRLTGDSKLCKLLYSQPGAVIELVAEGHIFHRLASQIGSLVSFTKLCRLNIISQYCLPSETTLYFTEWKISCLPKTLEYLSLELPYSFLPFTNEGYKELGMDYSESDPRIFQQAGMNWMEARDFQDVSLTKLCQDFSFINLNSALPNLKSLEIYENRLFDLDDSRKRQFTNLFLPSLPKGLTHLDHEWIAPSASSIFHTLSISSLVARKMRWEELEYGKILPLTELYLIGSLDGNVPDYALEKRDSAFLSAMTYNLSGLRSLMVQSLPPPRWFPFLKNLTSLDILDIGDMMTTEALMNVVRQHFPLLRTFVIAQDENDVLADLTPFPTTLTSFEMRQYGYAQPKALQMPDNFWALTSKSLTSLILPRKLVVKADFFENLPHGITYLDFLIEIQDYQTLLLPKSLRYFRPLTVVCTGRLLPQNYLGPFDESSVIEKSKKAVPNHFLLDAQWRLNMS